MIKSMARMSQQEQKKLPWFLEISGPKRIKKGRWVIPLKYTDTALNYLRFKPLLELIYVNLIIQQVEREKN